MRIGIDNYGLEPLQLSPTEVLQWALRHDAEGVAYSGFANRPKKKFPRGLLQEIKSFAQENKLYLEWGGGQHFGYSMDQYQPIDIFPMNQIVAEEAAELNCKVVRSCSGGLMRWDKNAPSTEEFLASTAKELLMMKPVLKDLEVAWAIETHFEFTSFELVRLFENEGFYPGEGIGICLDSMNLLTMLEDPVKATERLAPWILSTHIKDGGFAQTKNGLVSYPAGIGFGKIDLSSIIEILEKINPALNLNVEDHNGSFNLPIESNEFMHEFPDLDADTLEWISKESQVSEQELAILENEFMNRAIWPAICEERMIADLKALKKIYSKDHA